MDITSFVLGYNKGKASGGNGAAGDVFPQQELNFTEFDGIRVSPLGTQALSLTVGNTYYVKWDNDPLYTVTAIAGTFSGMNGVGIGNSAILGVGEDNGLPFAIGVVDNGSAGIYTTSTAESHSVGIYGDMTEEPVGVEETIDLANVSFDSNGMAEVIPDAGTMFSKIALLAAQSGGGGAKNVVKAEGAFTAETKSQTVTHNLGVVPDIAILQMMNTTTTNTVLIGCIGYGEALHNALGGGNINSAHIVMSGGANVFSDKESIEKDGSSANLYGAFHRTTATSFTVGGSTCGLEVGKSYKYVLIGGLM